MKKKSIIFAITASVLIWSSNGLALDNQEVTSTTAQSTAPADEGLPWFTGPLLAGGANTVGVGTISIQPYLFYTKTYGSFDADRKANSFPNNIYSFSPLMTIATGLTKWMDISAAIPYVFNSTNGVSSNGIGDSTVSLGFQLLKNVTDTWRPSIRAIVSETFPTGKFENLDSDKNGIDATGAGAYQTGFGLNFQHMWHVGADKYFRDRLSLGYTLPATSKVRGTNAFGGDEDTNGKVKIGNQFSADFAMEYTLTKHWVPAVDVLYTTNGSSTFSGIPGITPGGLPAIGNSPSGDRLSVAPAIEYNINSHWGIIAGPWFSVAGRNSAEFTSAVVSVSYSN